MENQIDISEKTLLSALKNDDVKAFDKLFAHYGKRLYHFAYGYLKSKEEAEEVVQEVFLRIWRNRKHLNPDLSFKAYLRCKHYLINCVNGKRRFAGFCSEVVTNMLHCESVQAFSTRDFFRQFATG